MMFPLGERLSISLGLHRRAGTGFRRSALIELGLFLVIALGIDYAFLGGTHYRNVAPHPFWIPVILLSIQYGVNEGIAAAVICTIVYLAGGIPPTEFGDDVYAHWFGILIQPILWLVSAVAIGEVRARHARRERELERDLEEARREASTITDGYEAMKTAKNALEARLASELRTALTLYEGAKAIDRLDVGQVIAGVGDLVRPIFGPKKFSMFVVNGNALEAVLAEGWQKNDVKRRFFASDTALFQAIVAEGEVLSVTDPKQEAVLEGEGVLAAPLVDQADGTVVGMLKVEEMAFIDLTASSLDTFRMVAEWVGSALAQARAHEELDRTRLHGDDPSLFSRTAFEHERHLIDGLGKRFGFPSSVVRIIIDRGHLLLPAERIAIAEAIADVGDERLRATDLVYELDELGREFAIILPGTPVANAKIVRQKIIPAVETRMPQLIAGCSIVAEAEAIGHTGKSDEDEDEDNADTSVSHAAPPVASRAAGRPS